MASNKFNMVAELELNDEAFKSAIKKQSKNVQDLAKGVEGSSGNVSELAKALRTLKNISFAGKSQEEINKINSGIANLEGKMATLRQAQKGVGDSQENTTSKTSKLKDALSGLGGNVNGLTGQFGGMTGSLTAMIPGLNGVITGLKGVKVALISTGIGALFVALGLAIAAVTRYFKQTEEGQIVFKKVMNNIKAYTEPVLSLFSTLGKAVYELFKGNFKEAWKTAQKGFKEVGSQIKENVANVGELNDAEEELIKLRRKNAVQNSNLEAEISELRNKGKDVEKYNAEQRLAYMDQAIAKQKIVSDNKRKELELETKVAEFKAAQGDNDIATNDELNQLIVRRNQLNKEEQDRLRAILETRRTAAKEYAKSMLVEVPKLDIKVDDINLENIDKEIEEEFNNILSEGDDKSIELPFSIEPVGLSKLQNELKELQTLQKYAVNPEAWQRYQEQIDITNQKMAEFKGEVESAYTLNELIAGMASDFSMIGSAIGGAAGAFFDFASQMSTLIPQLITQITALTVAKQGEAMASGVAASQSVPFPFNLISLAATVSAIVAAFAKIPKFETGGVVPGSSYTGDSVPIMANSGELILNKTQQAKLFRMINSGNSNQIYGDVRFEVEGTKLVGVLNNYNRKISKIR